MTDDEEILAERVAALEERVAELCERLDAAVNRDIPLLKGTVRSIVDAEIDEIGELPGAGHAFNRQVATYDERLTAVEQQVAALGDVTTEKTTKEQKLAAIGAYAANKRGGPSATVAVTADEIQGCVGVSRRYAYELIDEAADVVDGMRVRDARNGERTPGNEPRKKALLVNREQIHTDDIGVNQFTTGTTTEGARDAGKHSSEVER